MFDRDALPVFTHQVSHQGNLSVLMICKEEKYFSFLESLHIKGSNFLKKKKHYKEVPTKLPPRQVITQSLFYS